MAAGLVLFTYHERFNHLNLELVFYGIEFPHLFMYIITFSYRQDAIEKVLHMANEVSEAFNEALQAWRKQKHTFVGNFCHWRATLRGGFFNKLFNTPILTLQMSLSELSQTPDELKELVKKFIMSRNKKPSSDPACSLVSYIAEVFHRKFPQDQFDWAEDDINNTNRVISERDCDKSNEADSAFTHEGTIIYFFEYEGTRDQTTLPKGLIAYTNRPTRIESPVNSLVTSAGAHSARLPKVKVVAVDCRSFGKYVWNNGLPDGKVMLMRYIDIPATDIYSSSKISQLEQHINMAGKESAPSL